MTDSDKPINELIGRHIRFHRLRKGMSQSKLGKSLGVSFQQVQKYERGANRVPSSSLIRIARALSRSRHSSRTAKLSQARPPSCRPTGTPCALSRPFLKSAATASAPRLFISWNQWRGLICRLSPKLSKTAVGRADWTSGQLDYPAVRHHVGLIARRDGKRALMDCGSNQPQPTLSAAGRPLDQDGLKDA
jgi:transcriptional regulator with XRE-family HTH domain